MDVADWLRKLGLEQYEPAFRANEIDADLLPRLTAEDLKDLGVSLVGHRRRLLDAIAALGAPTGDSPLPDSPPSAGEGRVGADAERRQLTAMSRSPDKSFGLNAKMASSARFGGLRYLIGETRN